MSANVENDILVLLSDAARHMRTYADQVAQAHGLTRAQWIILKRLEQQPDLSQNELAALAEVTPMTVARLVDRLEALEYDPLGARQTVGLRHLVGIGPHLARGVGQQDQDVVLNIGGHGSPRCCRLLPAGWKPVGFLKQR